MLFALEDVLPRKGRDVGLARHAGGEHELLGPQRDRLPVALDLDRPLLLLVVVGRRLRLRGAPVVELHHPRVHLQPVADLVLRGEDRPVLGELDVRHVVVPDRVVQAQRLVAAAPLIAGPRVLVDDDRRHAELAQARAEADAALAAADDHDVGLAGVPQLLALALALLEPRHALAVGAVLDTVRATGPLVLLVALELVEDGEQRPCLAVAQAQRGRCRARPRSRTRSTPR